MNRGCARSLSSCLSTAIAVGSLQSLCAQDLSPRAYVITPLHSNAVILSWSFFDGSIQFNGTAPVTGATGTYQVPIISYYHSFGFFGRSANITGSLPYAVGNFQGTVLGAETKLHRSGLVDSGYRLSVNLRGGPAMPVQQFVKWQQKILLGVSLKVVAPTGQYDPTKLINWGANRWGFKPEFGYSERWGHWVLDGYAGVWFFTKNPEFKTSLSGVENPLTLQKSSRIGGTVSIPVSKHQSVKFSYNDGTYIRFGGNYKSVSVAWQYSWLGRPK